MIHLHHVEQRRQVHEEVQVAEPQPLSLRAVLTAPAGQKSVHMSPAVVAYVEDWKADELSGRLSVLIDCDRLILICRSRRERQFRIIAHLTSLNVEAFRADGNHCLLSEHCSSIDSVLATVDDYLQLLWRK